jgi:hypothetical protein
MEEDNILWVAVSKLEVAAIITIE